MRLDTSFVLRRAAAGCIGGYQRHLSPRKGFHCAHRVLHGGESCSQFAKTAILERGIFASLSLARERFRECNSASRTLRERALKTDDGPFETSSHLPENDEQSPPNGTPHPQKSQDNCCTNSCAHGGCDLAAHAPYAVCDSASCSALDFAGCCCWA